QADVLVYFLEHRVDDQGLASPPGGEQIGVGAGCAIEDLAEDHRSPAPRFSGDPGWRRTRATGPRASGREYTPGRTAAGRSMARRCAWENRRVDRSDHGPTIRVVILLAIGVVVILVGQAGRDLLPPDDLREAEVGREMLTSGDFIIPHLAGLPFLEKPPAFPAVL